MSVYIKGMEMPKDGNETIIRIQPDGTVLDQYGHHLSITAVPVPPHGRLIDVDYADEYAYDELELAYCCLTNWEAARAMQKVYQAAPTIIPAEEGD